MLYELIGIARVSNMKEVRDLVRTMGSMVVKSGGVVRSTNWLGRQFLPHVVGKHQQLHFAGNHFSMIFVSSAKVQNDIYELLSVDPRMIRITVVKTGENLKQLARPWRQPPPV
ncbi:mitochondrial 37S ribosomal protein bS6m [Limtongia smithiae]|uniref:mitochondrial 37S ribosomal protein bS6m n=1 Tax=Limtongia smithiae TaxID=1125753 RepID=UPI0034CD48D2